MEQEDTTLNISIKEAKQIHNRFRLIMAISIATILLGVVAMMYFEGWGIIDSLYFSVVSLTTVGYGDLSPQTNGGKLFVVFYILIGIAIIATFINNLLKSLVARKIIKNHLDTPKND